MLHVFLPVFLLLFCFCFCFWCPWLNCAHSGMVWKISAQVRGQSYPWQSKPMTSQAEERAWFRTGASGANGLIKKPINRLLLIFSFTRSYIKQSDLVALCWQMDFSEKASNLAQISSKSSVPWFSWSKTSQALHREEDKMEFLEGQFRNEKLSFVPKKETEYSF